MLIQTLFLRVGSMPDDETTRCRGLELPERALFVAARMLQNARMTMQLEGAAMGAGGAQEHPLPSSSVTGIAKNVSTTRAAAVAKRSPATHPSKGSASATAAPVVTSTALTTKNHGGGVGNGKMNRRRRAGEPPVSREEFERILAVCRLPYSLTWADAAYELCLGEVGDKGNVEASSSAIVASAFAAGSHVSGSSYGKGKDKNKKRKVYRTREQFWASFGAALVGAREDCDDLLCG